MNDTYFKCLKIAFRIMAEENVTPMDNNFLYENNYKMYIKAWSYREAVLTS